MASPRYISPIYHLDNSISIWQPYRSTFELCHPPHTTSCGDTALIHPRQQTHSTAPWIPPEFECPHWMPENAILVSADVTSLHTNIPHENGIESVLHYMKLHANILYLSITRNHPEKQQSFIHGQAFSPTCCHSHGNQGCPTICRPLHGPSRRNHPGSLHLGNSFLEKIHRWHLPDVPSHHQITPIHEVFHEQPPPHDQIHFSTLHTRDILPRHEDPCRSRPQTFNNSVQKTHWLYCISTLPLQPLT